MKIPFSKKIEAIIVQLLVQLPEKFLCVTVVTKTYPNLVILRSFLKIGKKNLKKVHIDSEKLKYSFGIKRKRYSDYL